MAVLVCSFFSSRSFHTNYNLPLFLPPKRYYSSALHSHNSRITRIKRRSHHLLLLFKPSPFAASASDIDLISTHEHSDGSFLFRFGDPSEIKKNVEMEEPKTVEEIEGEDKNGTSVVKLKEGSDKAEVIASGLTEASDHADSIVSSSNTVMAVKGESEYSEKLLEDDTDLPVSTSNKEIGGISTPELGIEHVENVEDINEECKDSSTVGASILDESSKIENSIATFKVSSDVSLEETSNVISTSKETNITSIPGVDKRQLTVNVEECPDQEDSPEDASIVNQSSEVVNNVTTVALSAKENVGVNSSDIDTDQSGKVDEGLNDDHEDSPVDSTVLDKSSEVVNGTSTVALLEEETDDITSISDVKIEPTGNVKGGFNEEYEDSSMDDTSVLDNRSEVLNIITAEASLEKETAEITSTSDNEIEPTGNVEDSKDEENQGSPVVSVLDNRSEVLNIITAEVSSEKGTDDITFPSDIEIEPTGNVVEGMNEEYEDSPVDTSVLNKSEVLNIITTEKFSEEETADITSTSDIEIDPTRDVEESKDEEYEDSSVDTSMLDKKSEVLNIISTEASSEEETVNITSTYDIEIEPIGIVVEIKDENTSVLSKVLNIISTEASLEEETVDITTSYYIEIVPIGIVVESKGEECADSPVDTFVLSKVLNIIRTEALSEKETNGISFPSDIKIESTGNVEEGIDEEYEDSPGEMSMLDKTSGVLNVITTEESSEKETADITSTPNIDIEHTGNVEVEQGLDEVLEEPSSEDASRPNMRPEVENNNTELEFLGKKTANANSLVAFKTDPVVVGLDTDSHQGSLEVADTANAAPISEHQNEETVIRDETIGDGGESFDNNLVSPSPELEPAMSLNEKTEEPILQAELQTLAIEESSETDVDNIKAIEIKNVLSNDNESDMYGAEAKPPTTEPAMTWSIGSEDQTSGVGSGIPKETVGYASENDTIQLITVPPQLESDSTREEETGTQTVKEPRDDDASENQTVDDDLVEASVHKVIALESTESTITSQEMLITDFVLSSGAALLPHPSKVLTGGEDAYFIAGQTWLGLADGVSQWSLEGTTKGVYAQELIKNCEKLITDCNGNSINNPIELLNLSVSQTHSPGSSTVLIAQFDGQALHVVNVGDSGFIVLRHGAVYKRSSPMHHAFSIPVLFERGDDPSCVAQLYRVDLEEEDLIVLATDGLLENLYDQEISLIAMKSLADNKSPEEIAVLLAKRALEVGTSSSGRSPFADDAQAAGFPGYSGGKLDDVAVIVSVVQRRR